ncbi:hypothetical protein TNIN_51281 [Trichonephila inaurata madagascariensis]|uniref:Uncharacterized protein n=1 Tax=Trichonephila inaurata madagascariensis TaxID=2747483 RepID=A0A8X6XLL2_9ARAC|nr:hypothetical protein TNIN_51281 [Trichonephila inaurata madagascariensis]
MHISRSTHMNKPILFELRVSHGVIHSGIKGKETTDDSTVAILFLLPRESRLTGSSTFRVRHEWSNSCLDERQHQRTFCQLNDFTRRQIEGLRTASSAA